MRQTSQNRNKFQLWKISLPHLETLQQRLWKKQRWCMITWGPRKLRWRWGTSRQQTASTASCSRHYCKCSFPGISCPVCLFQAQQANEQVLQDLLCLYFRQHRPSTRNWNPRVDLKMVLPPTYRSTLSPSAGRMQVPRRGKNTAFQFSTKPARKKQDTGTESQQQFLSVSVHSCSPAAFLDRGFSFKVIPVWFYLAKCFRKLSFLRTVSSWHFQCCACHDPLDALTVHPIQGTPT